jgi:RNA polymerase sigma-B factor
VSSRRPPAPTRSLAARIDRRRQKARAEAMTTDELLRLLGPHADPDVEAEVLRRFAGLATSCAQAFRSSGEPMDELVQVARIGLCAAMRRFDPDRGFSFRSFAVPTINGELKRHLRDHTWSLKVDRTGKEASVTVRMAAEALRPAGAVEASSQDVARYLGWSLTRVTEAFTVSRLRRSTRIDQCGFEPGSNEQVEDTIVSREVLRSLLANLGPRERLILHLRFVEDRSQQEIAREIGVSQVQVSRLLSTVLASLRARSRTMDLRERVALAEAQ